MQYYTCMNTFYSHFTIFVDFIVETCSSLYVYIVIPSNKCLCSLGLRGRASYSGHGSRRNSKEKTWAKGVNYSCGPRPRSLWSSIRWDGYLCIANWVFMAQSGIDLQYTVITEWQYNRSHEIWGLSIQPRTQVVSHSML